MSDNVRKWLEKDGVEFLKRVGLKEGQAVLDFGCGEGHYTIPAAEIVGEKGKVYALDKDIMRLTGLKELARLRAIKNMEILNRYSIIPLEDESLDLVLCYDVIHYQDKSGRSAVYGEIHRVLKKEGIFSVYPKHHKQDYPLNGLADMDLEEVMREIEESEFRLKENFGYNLLHDNGYNEGLILNFVLLKD
jgi:ubiquinone/menaquinone biosynthesis C-methylase UbiE